MRKPLLLCCRIFRYFAQSKGHTFIYKALPVKRLFGEFLDSVLPELKYPDNPYWSSAASQGAGVSVLVAACSFGPRRAAGSIRSTV